jgi:hypothetical protein
MIAFFRVWYGIRYRAVCTSVADPDPFNTDRDPAFQFDTDSDQAFQFDTDPNPTV